MKIASAYCFFIGGNHEPSFVFLSDFWNALLRKKEHVLSHHYLVILKGPNRYYCWNWFSGWRSCRWKTVGYWLHQRLNPLWQTVNFSWTGTAMAHQGMLHYRRNITNLILIFYLYFTCIFLQGLWWILHKKPVKSHNSTIYKGLQMLKGHPY